MAFPKMLPFCLITPHQSRERQQRQRLRSNLLCPTTDTLTAGTLPMGNTSSVIDGEPSHALRALLLRRLESRFSSRYREYPSDPRRHAFAPVDTYSALSSSKELPSTHYFRDAQPCFRTRNSIRNSFEDGES